jgi:hypothetical protein
MENKTKKQNKTTQEYKIGCTIAECIRFIIEMGCDGMKTKRHAFSHEKGAKRCWCPPYAMAAA